jgi:uncharacterized membrane protein
MGNSDTAKWYSVVTGVVLVLVGILGFINNPIVGAPTDGNQPLFLTDTIHNIVHLASGLFLLYVAYGVRGAARGTLLIAFGVVYALVLVVTLLDQEAFGLFPNGVNAADHVLHLVLAVASIAVGWMVRNDRDTIAMRRA